MKKTSPSPFHTWGKKSFPALGPDPTRNSRRQVLATGRSLLSCAPLTTRRLAIIENTRERIEAAPSRRAVSVGSILASAFFLVGVKEAGPIMTGSTGHPWWRI